MTVRLIKDHCHSENLPIKVLKKEPNGDHELLVHRTALSEIYKLTGALRTHIVIIEESKFSEGYFRISII